MHLESKGNAAVAWLKGARHRFYEDRYRILTHDIPLVAKGKRGEIFAVFDGIGSAPRGMNSAQAVCDQLLRFYRESETFPATAGGLDKLLMEANTNIHGWGLMPGTDRPIGGCAGTVAWIHEGQLTLFHAGDTAAILIRDGNIRQLTQAHETHGGIFRYFGLGPGLTLDIERIQLHDGDILLLVSDGVTKVFNPNEAARLVAETFDKTGEFSDAAAELTSRARAKGSSDDITVLVIEICPS